MRATARSFAARSRCRPRFAKARMRWKGATRSWKSARRGSAGASHFRGAVQMIRILISALMVFGAFAGPAAAAVAWQCPDGYQVHEGLNVDFPHKGLKRSFWVYPPREDASPAPVWVPLTGTVESTNDNLTSARSGANALMAQQGFMVIGPVRQCAEGDPAYSGPRCNGLGADGWIWKPWNEGRAPDAGGDKWKQNDSTDTRIFQEQIRSIQ